MLTPWCQRLEGTATVLGQANGPRKCETGDSSLPRDRFQHSFDSCTIFTRLPCLSLVHRSDPSSLCIVFVVPPPSPSAPKRTDCCSARIRNFAPAAVRSARTAKYLPSLQSECGHIDSNTLRVRDASA